LSFAPELLHRAEFAATPYRFDHADVWGRSRSWELPAGTLAFTYCGTPICYELSDGASIAVEAAAGAVRRVAGVELPASDSEAIFARDGSIVRITVCVDGRRLRLDGPAGMR